MIERWGSILLVIIVLGGWVGLGRPTRIAEAAEAGVLAAPAEVEAAQQLRSAQRTQQATRGSLRILSSGTRCADARYVAYRRSDREPEVVDQWYVVSQLWADAALLSADGANPKLRADVRAASKQARSSQWDEADTRCHFDKGFVFLDRLWTTRRAATIRGRIRTGARSPARPSTPTT